MATRPNKVARPWVKETVAFGRELDFSWFYNQRKWRKVSKAYKETHPYCECVDCQATDTIKVAKVCDHKLGLKFLLDNKLDPYSYDELQAMSNECHNKKSGGEAHYRKRGMG